MCGFLFYEVRSTPRWENFHVQSRRECTHGNDSGGFDFFLGCTHAGLADQLGFEKEINEIPFFVYFLIDFSLIVHKIIKERNGKGMHANFWI